VTLPISLSNTIPAADPVYEIPTFNRFISAALSGDMPGNVQTELPLFPPMAIEYLGKPYKEWAPEPFASIPVPQGPFGGNELSPPPIIRFMHIISGMDDIFEEAFRHVSIGKTGPNTVERSFRATQRKAGSPFHRMKEHFTDISDLVRDCSYQ
jgi:hypothetical protein